MNAIVLTKYGSSDVLKLMTVEKPVPLEDQVLVKVHAAAVNDWDWSLMRGKPFYIRLLCGLLKPKIRIPGAEIAGRVEAIGNRISRFSPGDDVYGDISECGFGGFAEYVCVPEDALAQKPHHMTYQEAAAMPHAAMLALQGLHDEGQIQPGHKVLINGAGGGVGTLGVQIARAMGVTDVTGVDSGDKSDMMLSLGFERTIDYTREDFTTIKAAYDVILDTKTNRSPFKYLRALKHSGVYVTVGGSTGRLIQTLLVGTIIQKFSTKRLKIVGLKPNRDLNKINQLYKAGKIKPVLDGPYTLSEVPRVINYYGQGRHKGKVAIHISEEN